jgi:hypothetical protein
MVWDLSQQPPKFGHRRVSINQALYQLFTDQGIFASRPSYLLKLG